MFTTLRCDCPFQQFRLRLFIRLIVAVQYSYQLVYEYFLLFSRYPNPTTLYLKAILYFR